MKLLLKIMYDGSGFAGYQAQPGARTVQGTLTEAVSVALGFPCAVTGCSRTDAGVHALGFCCTVEPRDENMRATDWLRIPVGRFHRALAHHLPEDVSVCAEAEVDDAFHARYSVASKEYVYRMYDTAGADPFMRSRAWHLKRPITDEGLSRMREAAEHVVGRHDFTSFMASGSKITDATRTVYSLSVERAGGAIEIRISADGFLYNMVRIIAGTLVDCAYGVIEPCELEEIIAARDRTRAGRTAPPDGLYLADVRYGCAIDWKIF